MHRSYNPKGSFLVNLNQSDINAIKIGLTGTPLLGDDYNSKSLFGNYIHKYYYNSSIADGYMLRLIKEEIQTNYKIKLKEILNDIEIEQGLIDKKAVFSHKNFVKAMLEYIINDFENSRIMLNDNSIGAMVICESSQQAKAMFKIFNEKYAKTALKDEKTVKKSALILHDVGTKQERKAWIEDFKDGKIDILFVYNTLLTGFDAKRLKKLYIGRVIKKHNLLQALTRVNRAYKDFKYGFVVDFADISKEFDAANKAYFDELQSELGDEIQSYSDLFKSKEEIENEIEDIKDVLFNYETKNLEIFSQQISQIKDVKQIQVLAKALQNAKNLYNLIRLIGHYDILEKFDIKNISYLYSETQNHLELLNLKNKLESGIDTSNILNLALENTIFSFEKVGQEELILADTLKDSLRKTREALLANFDKKDAIFVFLKAELERLFKNKNLNQIN